MNISDSSGIGSNKYGFDIEKLEGLPNELLEKIIGSLSKQEVQVLLDSRSDRLYTVVSHHNNQSLRQLANAMKGYLPEDKKGLIDEYLRHLEEGESIRQVTERFVHKVEGQKLLKNALSQLTDQQVEQLKKEVESSEEFSDCRDLVTNLLDKKCESLEKLSALSDLKNAQVVDVFNKDLEIRAKATDSKKQWEINKALIRFLLEHEEVEPVRRLMNKLTDLDQKKEVRDVLVRYDAANGNWEKVCWNLARLDQLKRIEIYPREEEPDFLKKVDITDERIHKYYEFLAKQKKNWQGWINIQEHIGFKIINQLLAQGNYSQAMDIIFLTWEIQTRVTVAALFKREEDWNPEELEKFIDALKERGFEGNFDLDMKEPSVVEDYKNRFLLHNKMLVFQLSTQRRPSDLNRVNQDLISKCREQLGEENAEELRRFMNARGVVI